MLNRTAMLLILVLTLAIPAFSQPPVTGNVYPVQNGPAGQLAPRVRQMLAQANQVGEVVIDRTNNRLIVRGGPDAQRVAAESIAALDVVQVTTASDKPVLRALPVPADQLHEIERNVGLQYRKNVDVRITGDEKTGQLLVMAPAGLHDEIQRNVHQAVKGSPEIQQVSANVGQPVRAQFALHNASWRDFEDGLARLAGRKLPVTTQRNGELASFDITSAHAGTTKVQIDRRDNKVTVVAPKTSINGWQRVIETIDRQEHHPGVATQLMRIENAEQAPIRRAVRLLSDIRPVVAQEDDTIGVAGGGRDNPLLRAVMQRQAAAGNGQAGGDDGQAGDAGGDDAFNGLFGDVQIEFVPELGVIIVRGAKRDVQRVMEVIKQIEEQSAVTQPKVEVVALEHANSNAVAEIVNQLYEQVLAPRQGQVSITALDKPNAILLIGRDEAVAGVIDLIKKVDQPVDVASQFRVFNLKHASALDVQATVQGFFVDRPSGNEDLRPGLGARARIIADYRSNSIIAQASPRDMLEVERMIEQLDAPATGAESELKVFKLKNAFAEDLQPVLQAAISGQPEDVPDNTTIPSSTLSILSVDAQGNKTLDSGILSGVVVTADANVNAIIVRAPAASMPLIGELITQLDQLPGAESVVKVFTIVNGDATQLTTSLQELFSAEGQTNSSGVGNLAAMTQTSNSETSLIALRFAVDIRTNSIIASGSATDLEVVESLLIRLDTEGFSARITETIWLRNAAAADVATALQDFVNQQSQLQSRNQFFSQNLGPYDLPERDLIVVPEARTNSLVISVSPRLYEDVRRVIDQLDRRPPMIMIQVVLAEVTLTDGFEFGTELGLQDSVLFDRGVASTTSSTPGFNFLPNSSPGLPNANTYDQENLAGQVASAFALGRQSSEFGYGGFVLSAASESVNLLLRMLQDSGRAQILSRPQIMTLDGTEGYVQVGSLFPRIESVQAGNANSGTVIATQDINLGLILRVTPRVGQDGLIVMNVDAQRSNVDPNPNNGQPIATDSNDNPIISPQILITQAQSTVTAMSGQTVVFGGLITKSRRQFSRRVPYVSDIPILGQLFRFDQEIEERTEMLIVLTPRVVNGEEDIQLINDAESSRMSYCLADVVELHGDAGLRGGYGLWGPAVGAMIYPDMHPTVDHFPTAPQDPLLGPGEQIVPGSLQQRPIDPSQQPVQTVPYESSGEVPAIPQAPGLIEQATPIQAADSALNMQPQQRVPMEVFSMQNEATPNNYAMPPSYATPVQYNAPMAAPAAGTPQR
ncbi:secretin N-terminal domain-containing protein [Rosistilla oblonga]|uniref:secretin N-terminal domain-containing protein n=1 Tax=Rosistilla oblonga TaxID=2527990 RepID=UPI003A97185B